ncbi:hypothetical protein BJ878DRAFT_506131 [Calycina marina]|uniref:PWI domain-containing protein n=1 Tax=Calycina marina TaxID=1763456 RepID=A0A9P7Z3Y7_9HELO|nr:hypothetical protein BJ878DRAFT_506131 [Calycina marina]
MTTVDDKILRTTKFPIEFNQKVDIQKVNADLMKKWMAGRIQEILGSDDDVVIELCFGLFEGARHPDIKKMQIQLTGFLDKDTPAFCKELWKLCLSAQANPEGVPQELVEAKKAELMQEKIETDRRSELARLRGADEQRRESNMSAIRERERNDRSDRGWRGGRGDSFRDGRGDNRRNFDRGGGRNDDRDFGRGSRRGGGRGYERRGPRSRSPHPRRDSRDREGYAPRGNDSYIPRGRDNGRRGDERRRSPTPRSPISVSSRSRSDSRSPLPTRRRSRSRSRSPPRRYRSPSPVRRSIYRGRGYRGEREQRGRERRSLIRRSDSRSSAPSVSLSPPRKRRRTPSPSHSRSPRRLRCNTSSMSRSPSPARSFRPAARGWSRSPSGERRRIAAINDKDIIAPRGESYKARDERRLTRSPSRSISPRRRRSRSRSQSSSVDTSSRKRRRSMQRYEPSKRRRNSSSVSPPRPVNTKADMEKGNGRQPINRDADKYLRDVEPREVPMKPLQVPTAELKEKLLREKIL